MLPQLRAQHTHAWWCVRGEGGEGGMCVCVMVFTARGWWRWLQAFVWTPAALAAQQRALAVRVVPPCTPAVLRPAKLRAFRCVLDAGEAGDMRGGPGDGV